MDFLAVNVARPCNKICELLDSYPRESHSNLKHFYKILFCCYCTHLTNRISYYNFSHLFTANRLKPWACCYISTNENSSGFSSFQIKSWLKLLLQGDKSTLLRLVRMSIKVKQSVWSTVSLVLSHLKTFEQSILELLLKVLRFQLTVELE